MELPQYVINWLFNNALKFPNVVGFSMDFSILQMDGVFSKSIDDMVRFYVTKKVNQLSLLSKELIPSMLTIRNNLKKHRFETDIIEIGQPQAIPPIPFDVYTSEIDKTNNFRPVELGVSVGNEAITAGSLGMLYKVLEDNPEYGVKVGDDIAGTNAHVDIPNPMWSIDEVIKSKLVNILQRGTYHGGSVPNDVVGKYLWHQQIYGSDINSDCPVSVGSVKFLNLISNLLGRKSRFRTVVPLANSIDFGLYKLSVEHILKIADNSIDTAKQFGAHLFAGSETSGILCHISEILNQCPIKIRPKNDNYEDFKVGDRVKGCSFWCNYETDVIDVNGVVNVGYGGLTMAPFVKVGIVNNDGTIKGGWSGSSFFLVERDGKRL